MKIVVILMIVFVSLYANKYITNFGKKITIDNSITIMPNVIVKTSLDKSALHDKLKQPLKQIAFLGKNNLFLVESNDSISYANELSTKDYIIYAQPDILQKREMTTYQKQSVTVQYHLTQRWKKTKGEGVKVAIIDDGFNLIHEDLKEVKVAFEYDADFKDLNASEKSSFDTHGTQVTGIIFAQHNGFGIDGIAPNAELIAIRQSTNLTSETILAFTVASLAGADIINCSWNSPVLLEPVYETIKYLAQNARDGKGIAIVVSAGNSAKEIQSYSTEASIEEVITVGATQKYSNYGDMVDFIIPSGIQTTQHKGYGLFGGTSATAPIISGLLALKMSKTPNKNTNEIVKSLKEELHGR